MDIRYRNFTNDGIYKITEGFEGVKCASEGEQCSCLGQIHYGLKADGLEDMHKKGNVSIVDTRSANQNTNGFIYCGNDQFKSKDVAEGGHECYCLKEKIPDPLPSAHHCADAKGLEFCECFGTVYYGRRLNKETNQTLSFAEMTKHGWTSTLA